MCPTRPLLGNLGPVHTNPFSNENGAVLLWMRLSSTLRRRKRSSKAEPFEKALQTNHDCQTKCLMSRTIAVHVRYKSFTFRCRTFSAKQQREMTKFFVFWRT